MQKLVIALAVVIVAGVVVFFLLPSKSQAPIVDVPLHVTYKDLVRVYTPSQNAQVSSPLSLLGEARGTWYFEASFPVELKDASGKTIAQVPAQAQGDWMTTEFVPFSLSLTFPAQPSGSKGTLILHKDNPSGNPARDDSVSIPVVFK